MDASALERKERHMELDMNELGRIGNSMALRPPRADLRCVIYDLHSEAEKTIVKESEKAVADKAGA
jgi:6-phosphogluconate dehydrogenase (decarboxylating)